MSVGGSFLAFAVEDYFWAGFLILFLLIGLSTYAFRLYISKIQKHMDDLEEIVAERTLELTNFMEEKDAFLGILTHEMRTPLTNINLFLDLLEAHPTILNDEPELIESMRSNQRNLLNTANNILDLEKPKSDGALHMKRDTFNLVQSIELVANAMKLQAEKKQISLHYQFDTQSLFIHAEHQQIERVLLNLISNAIKYTQTTGTVIISALKKKHHIVITVKDNGYGIPPEELPFIFDRYSRVNIHKHKAEGTGLGLAITKAIVEAHCGEITVSSREGFGTTFKVQLPAEC